MKVSARIFFAPSFQNTARRHGEATALSLANVYEGIFDNFGKPILLRTYFTAF